MYRRVNRLEDKPKRADTISICQFATMVPGNAVVISEDTDVFVLLLNFNSTGDIETNVLVQPTSADCDKVIDITAT